MSNGNKASFEEGEREGEEEDEEERRDDDVADVGVDAVVVVVVVDNDGAVAAVVVFDVAFDVSDRAPLPFFRVRVFDNEDMINDVAAAGIFVFAFVFVFVVAVVAVVAIFAVAVGACRCCRDAFLSNTGVEIEYSSMFLVVVEFL